MGIFTGYPAFLDKLLDGLIRPLRLYDGLIAEPHDPTSLSGTFEEDLHVIPIGGIYLSTVNTNPGLAQASGGLGYGAWVRAAHGRCIVGVDEADSDWDTGGEISGSKTATPTGMVDAPLFDGDVLPVHTHELPFMKATGGVGQVKFLASTIFGQGVSRVPESISVAPTANNVAARVALSESKTAGVPTGTVSAPAFTGDELSVVQPSFAVYIWRRTS